MFDFSRRDFLKGLFAGTALTSFSGMRLFGANETDAVAPNLRFGVVSDVHIAQALHLIHGQQKLQKVKSHQW